ncbi:ABC transporter permease [Paenibacillus oenotherae]|uniref:ABC transporter permease n=1 Tax=Paenibacillus oenotherae TaxID=1435645 RepID=A0ABS7D227_9BACL|nr:ABC transporter permease [Paenibacillus oenotherae]MBW7473989.1 ABC transporter permease [Paenibacillus oenotherae]
MKLLSLIHNEARKIGRSVVFWVMLAVFTVLPLMIAVFNSSAANWEAYFADLLGSIGSLLVVGFSFTSAWVFGMEYTNNTLKDMLVKPVPKSYSVLAKFIVIALWNTGIAVFTFAVIAGAGTVIGVSGGSLSTILTICWPFMAASLLIMLVSTTSALFANLTRGYLAPIGITFVIVIVSNVVVQLGYGLYFPWTIPVLLLTGAELDFISMIVLAATGIAGFAGTVAWWRFAEHK